MGIEELCYLLELGIEIQSLVKSTKEEKIAAVTKMQLHQIGSHNLWL